MTVCFVGAGVEKSVRMSFLLTTAFWLPLAAGQGACVNNLFLARQVVQEPTRYEEDSHLHPWCRQV